MNMQEDWDREAEINQMFDPNDVSNWLKYSPEEFLALIINEIRRENILIRDWSKILHENPQFRSQALTLGNSELEATFFTDVNLRASRIIDRLLNTAAAYREEFSKKDNNRQ